MSLRETCIRPCQAMQETQQTDSTLTSFHSVQGSARKYIGMKRLRNDGDRGSRFPLNNPESTRGKSSTWHTEVTAGGQALPAMGGRMEWSCSRGMYKYIRFSMDVQDLQHNSHGRLPFGSQVRNEAPTPACY